MELRYQAGRSIRHVAGAMTEAALVVAIAVALVFAASAATGNGPAGAGQVSAGGAVTGTISLGGTTARAASLKYGSSVRFDTSVDGRLTSKARVYVRVICEQGGLVIFQASADPGTTFTLEQQDGLKALGYVWDPATDASCTGELMYREDGGKIVIKVLDKVPFATSGS